MLLDSVHAAWKSWMTSSESFLCAVAPVAWFGIVAAMTSRIWGVRMPAAVVRREISGPVGWICARQFETSWSHDGWRGIFVCGGF